MSSVNIGEEVKKGRIVIIGDPSLKDKFIPKQKDKVVFVSK